MAFNFPNHSVGEFAFDDSVKIPSHTVGQYALTTTALPKHTVGQYAVPALGIPNHVIGEGQSSAFWTGAITLPMLVSAGYDKDGIMVLVLPSLTSTAYGGGSAAATLPSLTSTATGNLLGFGAVTLPMLTSTGSPGNYANLTLPMLTSVGTSRSFGAGAGVLPMLDSSGVSLTGNTTTSTDNVLPFFVSVGHGAGNAKLILPMLISTGVLVSTNVGIGAASLPMLVVGAAGISTNVINGAVVLPALQNTGVLLTGGLGRAALILPSLVSIATGLTGAVGRGSATLPALESLGELLVGSVGIGQATLPMLRVAAEAVGIDSALFHGWVINTRTKGLSRYANFNFNSFANFNGMVLAAGANGVVVLGGADDNGVKIPSTITTSVSDYSSDQLKKIPRLYADYYAPAGMTISPSAPGMENFTYSLVPLTSWDKRIQQRRATLGMGLKASFWQFTIKNINGGDFRLEALTVFPEVSDRKVLQRG